MSNGTQVRIGFDTNNHKSSNSYVVITSYHTADVYGQPFHTNPTCNIYNSTEREDTRFETLSVRALLQLNFVFQDEIYLQWLVTDIFDVCGWKQKPAANLIMLKPIYHTFSPVGRGGEMLSDRSSSSDTATTLPPPWWSDDALPDIAVWFPANFTDT